MLSYLSALIAPLWQAGLYAASALVHGAGVLGSMGS